jgi:TonB family protein
MKIEGYKLNNQMTKKTVFCLLLILFSGINVAAQVRDTVFFDLEGEIIIKEVASYYRVAAFDTLTGMVKGSFEDYNNTNDSLIFCGYVSNDSIEEYTGDPAFLPLAVRMLDLKASYIRLNDYPALKNAITPSKTMETRIRQSTPYPEFKVLEAMPEFPGGIETLGWFLGQLMHYPDEAVKNNISGTVLIKFTVDNEGAVKNISVVKGIGYGCDEEAVRVMGLIPDWLPGIQHGKTVSVNMTIPITFQ